MNLKSIKALFLFILFVINFSFAQVSIKPGEISYIEVQYNNILVAGEAYNITLKFTDAFGNPSNNFGLASKIKQYLMALKLVNLRFIRGILKTGKPLLQLKEKRPVFIA